MPSGGCRPDGARRRAWAAWYGCTGPARTADTFVGLGRTVRVTSPDASDLSALSPLAPALASTIASLAGDVALVLDSEGVIRSVADGSSPAQSACAGWVGRRWVDTATADTRVKLERLLADVQSGGVARRREVNHPAPEGESIPLAWSALRLGDSGAVIAVGRDLRAVAAIQQRFLDTQQELERAYWRRRESASRDEELHQLARDALFLLDAATLRLREANDAALALLGRAREDALGQALDVLLPEAGRAALADLLLAARTRGRAGEIRLRLADGQAPLLWAATPFRGHGQQRLMLLRARDGAPAAVAGEGNAVLVVDAASRVQTANAAALQHLRVADEALLKGRPLTDVFAPDEAALWLSLVERARGEGLVARMPLGRGREALQVTAALLAESDQEAVGLAWLPRSGARAPAATPADTLRDLAAQLGQTPLRRLLALGRGELERHLIAAALWRAAGSVDEAALVLGLTREQLARRMQRLGLPAPGAVD